METDPVETSDDDVRDVLPEDLDAVGYVGPYVFPNNNKRRIPGVLYVLLGAGAIALAVAGGTEAVLVNSGLLVSGIGLVLFGLYSWQAGFPLDTDEQDALVAASTAVGFPVGHASAQLGWRGLRSRPTWRILLYSSEDPPATRGLVLVDGVNGEVLEQFTEDNPEDWAEYSPVEPDADPEADADIDADIDAEVASDTDPDPEPASDTVVEDDVHEEPTS